MNTHSLFWKRTILFFAITVSLATVWYWSERPRTIDAPTIPLDEKLQCASYTPFIGREAPWLLDQGLHIPRERIVSDLTLLSQRFSCIRTYSVTGLEAVPEIAAKLGLKVMLGIWINSNPVDSDKEIEKAIALAKASPAVIQSIVVGNEVLLRKEVPSALLVDYIGRVKTALPAIPVTYADVWEFWFKHPELAPAVDFITIHILPYWEDEPASLDTAIDHVATVYHKITEAFPDKSLFIGETGWPSRGRDRRGAQPSDINQARYIRSFVALARDKGWHYNLIEAFDQPWKKANEGTVGGYWGIYDTYRHDKGIFDEVMPRPQHWRWLVVASMMLTYMAWRGTRYAVERGHTVSIKLAIGLTTFWSGMVTIVMFADPRYREFPIAIMIPIVALTLTAARSRQSWLSETVHQRLALFFLIMAAAIVIQERPTNIEADTWALLCTGMALAHRRAGGAILWSRLWKAPMTIVTVALAILAFAAIRYGLMESASIAETCYQNHGGWCSLRDKIGWMIHFNIMGWTGLVTAIIAARRQKPIWRHIALAGSIGGLILYNFDVGAIGSMILLMTRLRRYSE